MEDLRLSHSPRDPPPEEARAGGAAARLAEYERIIGAAYGEPHPVYTLLTPEARESLFAGMPVARLAGPPPPAPAAQK